MNVTGEGLIRAGHLPHREGAPLPDGGIFNGVITTPITYWVFRFEDGPAKGIHGPFPLDAPEQFDLTEDKDGRWVLTPCSGGLALAVGGDHSRYERIPVPPLSNEEADEKARELGALRAARYRMAR